MLSFEELTEARRTLQSFCLLHVHSLMNLRSGNSFKLFPNEKSLQRSRRVRHLTTTATVIRAAVSELQPNSAVVLVFVKQKTASKEKPQPIVTSSSVRVTLAKVKGSWLIEKFEGL